MNGGREKICLALHKRVFCSYFTVLLISADVHTIINFMKHAAQCHDDEYAYIIIDLENKLGPEPWHYLGEENQSTLKVNRICIYRLHISKKHHFPK